MKTVDAIVRLLLTPMGGRETVSPNAVMQHVRPLLGFSEWQGGTWYSRAYDNSRTQDKIDKHLTKITNFQSNANVLFIYFVKCPNNFHWLS